MEGWTAASEVAMMVAAVTGVPREVGTAEGKQAAAVATAGRTTERQAGRRVGPADSNRMNE